MKPRDFPAAALGEWWLGDSIGILTLLPAMLSVILPKLGIGGSLAPDEGTPSDVDPRAPLGVSDANRRDGAQPLRRLRLDKAEGLHFGPPALFAAHLDCQPARVPRSRLGDSADEHGVNLSQMIFPGERYNIIELQTLMFGMSAAALLMGMVISERERTKRSLASSQRTNEAVLDAIPDLMFRMTRDGTYLDYHAQPGVTLLVPPDKFLNRTATEVLEPSLSRLMMRSIASTRPLSTGEVAIVNTALRASWGPSISKSAWYRSTGTRSFALFAT